MELLNRVLLPFREEPRLKRAENLVKFGRVFEMYDKTDILTRKFFERQLRIHDWFFKPFKQKVTVFG